MLVGAAWLSLGQASAETLGTALTIPAAHPRLWYGDSARLNQARAYFQNHAISIPGYPPSAAARNHALRFLMSGNPAECAPAIDWLMRFNFELADEDGDGHADPGSCDLNSEGLYCDRARWTGEDAILVYDWCNAQLTATQKNTLIARWDNYIGKLNQGPYGWPARPINNYYWGYLRNSLLWGIAASGESTRSAEFIAHALDQRYQQYFVPWSTNFGRGGVPGEGTQYGPYPLGYSVIALRSAADFGFDGHQATSFFGDSTYYLLYATSPSPTVEPGISGAHYEIFPFNDNQSFDEGGSALQGDYANLLAATILRAPSSTRARHARGWLQRTGVQPDWWLQAALAGAGGPSNTDDLPLDYYAAGYRFLYGRSSAANDAMTAVFELGALGADERGGLEHNGIEAGSFQLWRRDRFVSRNTVGYRGSDFVKGFMGVGRADINEAVAKNAVLFEGRGQLSAFHDQPRVTRLHSAPEFLYAAVDLRGGYRRFAGTVPQNQCWLVDEDWPYVDSVVREFLFLRAWNAVLVLDRLRASADSQLPIYANPCVNVDYAPKAPANVRKTFVVHYPARGAPVVNGRRVTADNGPLALDTHLLLPETAAPRVIDERDCSGCSLGQFRVEVDQTGTQEGYFLHVIQSRDVGAPPLTAQLTTAGNQWTVLLTRADGATATVRLTMGMTSTGGSVQFGAGPPQALLERQQGMTIEASGPVWEVLNSDGLFLDGFEAP